jgi:hypothetical protein
MLGNKIYPWVNKFRILIYILLGILLAAGVAYLLTYYILYPQIYISWSKFHLTFIHLAELFFLFLFLDIYTRNTRTPKFILGWQLAFWFAAANLIVVFVLANYYSNPARMQYRSVQLILPFIPAIKGILIFSTLFSFWIGFRESLIDAWRTFTFEDEKNEFLKGTLITVAVLLTSFMIGMGLRIFNLDGFPPYVDEYIHTHDATALIHGEPLEWDRAYLTVSFPVYLSYRVFGISLWASRLPMILINMLSILPLYALGKKINKSVGYISVVLFVFSPWILAVSRTVRDYAVAPLFFYLSAALLVDLLDLDGLSLKQYLLKHKYQLIVVILILGYAIYDYESILKIIIAIYGIFGMLAIFKILKQSPSRWLKLAVLCFGGILIILMVARSGIVHRYLSNGTFTYKTTPLYWLSLVHSKVHQWYFLIKELGYVILLIACLLAIRAVFKRYGKSDFTVLFCFMIFAANFVYLTFFLVDPRIPVRTRYGALMEYWYLMVVAIFLFVYFNLSNGYLRSAFLLSW